MKTKHFILFIALFLCFKFNSKAQLTTILPASTELISRDTSIYVDPSTWIYHNYLICNGVHFKVAGLSTYLMRFYLEDNAHVEVSDTFNFYLVADVFMKNNASFDFNRKNGSSIDTVMKVAGAMLIDTANSVTTLLIGSSVVFDYSLLPGGVSPCAASAGETTISTADLQVYPIPTQTKLNFNCPKLNGTAQLFLYNQNGQLLKCQEVKESTFSIDIASFSSGCGYYQLVKEATIIKSGSWYKL